MDDKYKLYGITIILDIILLLILYFNDLQLFDKSWVYLILVVHFIFYIALWKNNRGVLDILHVIIFIFPVLSIFAKNIFIKLVSIFLLIVIQILWVCENRCILNEGEQTFGYGNKSTIFCIIFTPVLALNMGYSMTNSMKNSMTNSIY
tara:strand:+ start:1428 stop:1871 length:444 start_codon:yes stop_codon:yes gene_type:complete